MLLLQRNRARCPLRALVSAPRLRQRPNQRFHLQRNLPISHPRHLQCHQQELQHQDLRLRQRLSQRFHLQRNLLISHRRHLQCHQRLPPSLVTKSSNAFLGPAILDPQRHHKLHTDLRLRQRLSQRFHLQRNLLISHPRHLQCHQRKLRHQDLRLHQRLSQRFHLQRNLPISHPQHLQCHQRKLRHQNLRLRQRLSRHKTPRHPLQISLRRRHLESMGLSWLMLLTTVT